MTRLEIHLVATTLQPIIQAAVETAIRRLQAELPCVKLNNGLVLFRPESLKAWLAST